MRRFLSHSTVLLLRLSVQHVKIENNRSDGKLMNIFSDASLMVMQLRLRLRRQRLRRQWLQLRRRRLRLRRLWLQQLRRRWRRRRRLLLLLLLHGVCFASYLYLARMKQVEDGFAAHVGSSNHIVLSTGVAGGNCLRCCHGDRLGIPHQFIWPYLPVYAICCHVRLHTAHTAQFQVL